MKVASSIALVVGLAQLAALTGPADATVLCRTKKGGLVVREACKKKEQRLEAQQIETIGLKGEPGAAGPPGPTGLAGPAGPGGGAGLRVVDATGKEVGLLTSLTATDPEYGTGGAVVIREITAPGGTGPEWFALSLSSEGFARAEYGTTAFDFVYASSDCTGARYFSVECGYGECSATPPLATFVRPQPDGATVYFGRASEHQSRQYYWMELHAAYTQAELSGHCMTSSSNRLPGTVVRDVYDCYSGPQSPSWCIECCRPMAIFDRGSESYVQGPTEAVPARTLDLSGLGLTAPFRISR